MHYADVVDWWSKPERLLVEDDSLAVRALSIDWRVSVAFAVALGSIVLVGLLVYLAGGRKRP